MNRIFFLIKSLYLQDKSTHCPIYEVATLYIAILLRECRGVSLQH